MIGRIFARLGKRWWIRHIDHVLFSAYGDRLIDSRVLHILDARLKHREGMGAGKGELDELCSRIYNGGGKP